MPPALLVRLTPPAAAGAAALISVAFALGLTLDARHLGQEATGTTFLVANALNLAGVVLLIVALVGLHARQAAIAGALGSAGFLAALLGCILAAGGYWTFLFAYPSVAVEAPALLDGRPAGMLLAGFGISTLGFGAGWLLFAIAALRAGTLSRAACWLWVAGGAASVVVVLFPVPRVCLLLTALGVGWAGLAPARAGRRVVVPA